MRNNKSQGKRPQRKLRADHIRSYQITKPTILLDFLFTVMNDKSKNTVKSLLKHKHIAINGAPTTQFDTPLNPGDEISINFDRPFRVFKSSKMRIMFEDDYIIVIDKTSGLLSMGTDRDKENTAYYLLSDYVKRQDPRNKIFIVHRLDRETSGVMLFAKTANAQTILQRDWDNMVLDRKYYAIVEGTPEKPVGELRSYLAENNAMNVYSTNEHDGKLAITQYRVEKTKGRYSLVELTLLTGRKNQIRVHMSEFGFPVAGDKKYGARTSPAKRLMLHASKLQFVHPMTRENMTFETPLPAKFKMVMEL